MSPIAPDSYVQRDNESGQAFKRRWMRAESMDWKQWHEDWEMLRNLGFRSLDIGRMDLGIGYGNTNVKVIRKMAERIAYLEGKLDA